MHILEDKMFYQALSVFVCFINLISVCVYLNINCIVFTLLTIR